MSFQHFIYNNPFTLESGYTLPSFHLAYTTHGTLNSQKDNAIWIFHALTANSDPVEWWPGLVGEGKLFDTNKFFIVCVNMPGSCYGSISPTDTHEETGKSYLYDFPFFTTRDMVRAYSKLQHHLAIERIYVGIGGSMGGQQLLEWAIEDPYLFEFIFPIATNAFHSPWGIAFNATQRHCIETDPTWNQLNKHAGLEGMKVARGIALLSYRNYETYQISQKEKTTEKTDGFMSESYQIYQGEKLAKRFNAFSYYFLSKSMDAHNVGRGRGGYQEALQTIQAKTMVIGISSDILFPVIEQQQVAEHIPQAEITIINSIFGHDGFLLEFEKISQIIAGFLLANKKKSLHVKSF